jgi:SAM-dependent methyltransferase
MADPNAEQFRYWNEEAGPAWAQHQAKFDVLVAEPGRAALARASAAAGETAIDVGCGCGATTLELAAGVGPAGRVLGLDLSAPMLARARERIAQAGVGNAVLAQGDAQVFRFEPATADLVFSRFGVMFFADPVAAFANLGAALRRGGRLAFVCWRALADNAWVRVPMAALAPHLPPMPPADPEAPGPFAFADAARVRGILERAGFGGIRVDPLDVALSIPGAGVSEAAEFLLQMGPSGRAVRESGLRDLAPLARVLIEVLEPHATPSGVRMAGAVHVVSALRP